MPLIAIEGGDGSGKTIHAELLTEWLRTTKGAEVLLLDYPRYDEHSAYIAKKYLNGDYGAANSVPPELASLAYAVDRAADKDRTFDFFAKHPNGVCVTNRYVNSNLAHQGTKISNPRERHQFYENIRKIEFEDLGIAKPILNITLLTPSRLAQQNIDKKTGTMRSYTKQKRDVHEADASHLDKAANNYREICWLYPNENHAIECADKDGELRPIADIQSDIRLAVEDRVFAADK